MLDLRDFFFFVPVLLSIITPLFVPSSFVCLTYFIFAIPMRVFWQILVHEFPFSVSILNGNCFFPTVQLQEHNKNPARYGRITDALVNLKIKLNQTKLRAVGCVVLNV